VEKIAETTRVRPVILTVASFIPVVGNVVAGAENLLTEHLEREREERLQYLVEELELGRDDFSGPFAIYRSEPVLHAAYVTIEATYRTSRREKIRAFAKLLLSALEDPARLDVTNEFEDYLKILDELSIREIQILAVLSEVESENARLPDENDLQWTTRHWDAFESAVIERVHIPLEELSGFLARLTRTGTFEPIVGTYFDYTGGNGMLTATYRRLATLIDATPGSFDTGRIV